MSNTNTQKVRIEFEVDADQVPQASDALKQIGVEALAVGDANAKAAVGAAQHTDGQLHLANALNVSRGTMGQAVSTAGELAGANAAITQGLAGLVGGLGPVGVGLTTVTILVKEYIDWLDKAAKKEIELANAERLSGEARSQAFADIQTKAALASLAGQADEVSRRLANMRAIADSPLGMFSSQTMEQQQADIAKWEGVLRDIENTIAALNTKSLVTGTQIEQVDTAARHYETLGGLINMINRSLLDGAAAADAAATAYAKTITPDPTGFESSIAPIKVLVKSWSDFDAETRKIASDYSSTQSKIRSEAAQTAAAEAALHQEILEASNAVSPQIAANFRTIENSALNAAQKTALLHQYIATLPRDVQAQINLWINTQGIAQLMALFGGSHLRRPGQGNQQGNQWNFDLAGEGFAVQQEWFNKYGNYDLANEAWKEAHRKELEAQGIPDEDPTLAAGGIVTRPTRAIIGEAGPEAIIPLGEGGIGGKIEMHVHINALINTAEAELLRAHALPEFERMLYEVKRRGMGGYMAKN